MSVSYGMEEYYQKMIELQDRLRTSEEERLGLEIKFNEILQLMKKEEESHLRKIRVKYKNFLEEDRQRQLRNDKIIQTLERIEDRTAMIKGKTNKFKQFQREYKEYIKTFPQALQHYMDQQREIYASCPSIRPESDMVETYLRGQFPVDPKLKCDFDTDFEFGNPPNVGALFRSCNKSDESTNVKTSKDLENSLRQYSPSKSAFQKSFFPSEIKSTLIYPDVGRRVFGSEITSSSAKPADYLLEKETRWDASTVKQTNGKQYANDPIKASHHRDYLLDKRDYSFLSETKQDFNANSTKPTDFTATLNDTATVDDFLQKQDYLKDGNIKQNDWENEGPQAETNLVVTTKSIDSTPFEYHNKEPLRFRADKGADILSEATDLQASESLSKDEDISATKSRHIIEDEDLVLSKPVFNEKRDITDGYHEEEKKILEVTRKLSIEETLQPENKECNKDNTLDVSKSVEDQLSENELDQQDKEYNEELQNISDYTQNERSKMLSSEEGSNQVDYNATVVDPQSRWKYLQRNLFRHPPYYEDSQYVQAQSNVRKDMFNVPTNYSRRNSQLGRTTPEVQYVVRRPSIQPDVHQQRQGSTESYASNPHIEQQLSRRASIQSNTNVVLEPVACDAVQYDEMLHPQRRAGSRADSYSSQQLDQISRRSSKANIPAQSIMYDADRVIAADGQYYDESELQYGEDQQGQLFYDENGQLVQPYGGDVAYVNDQQYLEDNQYGDGTQAYVDPNQYDENGQMLSYDHSGNAVYYNDENAQQHSDGHIYDENGAIIAEQYICDENGQPLYQYDENGQPVQLYDENVEYVPYAEDEQAKYNSTDPGVNGEDGLEVNAKNEQPIEEKKDMVDLEQESVATYSEKSNSSNREDVVSLEKPNTSDDSAKEDTEEKQEDDKQDIDESNNKIDVMDALETDSESIQQQSKVSNGSDFDFSNN